MRESNTQGNAATTGRRLINGLLRLGLALVDTPVLDAAVTSGAR